MTHDLHKGYLCSFHYVVRVGGFVKVEWPTLPYIPTYVKVPESVQNMLDRLLNSPPPAPQTNIRDTKGVPEEIQPRSICCKLDYKDHSIIRNKKAVEKSVSYSRLKCYKGFFWQICICSTTIQNSSMFAIKNPWI